MAQVKCKWCEKKDEKELMVKEQNFYLHKVCRNLYIEDKKIKQKELEDKTKLAETIAKIYGFESIKLIPRTFYPYIEDVRNDSQLFGRLGKNYKAGIPYLGIEYTYRYCEEKIKAANTNPNLNFKNTLAMLRYGLAIVRNNLADAKNDMIQKHKMNKSLAKTASIEKISYSDDEKEPVYIKKAIEDDISDILD